MTQLQHLDKKLLLLGVLSRGLTHLGCYYLGAHGTYTHVMSHSRALYGYEGLTNVLKLVSKGGDLSQTYFATLSIQCYFEWLSVHNWCIPEIQMEVLRNLLMR